jgi:hypothetical protein
VPTQKPKWTKIIVDKLKAKGKENGYDVSRSGKDIPVDLDSKLNLRPDVVWEKGGEIYALFETDTGAHNTYQKTAWGSMLGGIVLAKRYNCRFIQITPKDRVGDKTVLMAKTIKEYFKSLPFDVFTISRMAGKNARWNISSDVFDRLRDLELIT